jgi:Cu2+-exporting ATPase
LQHLASIDTVVFDKTGTLTCDAFTLADIHVRSGVSPEQALLWAAGLARPSVHPVSRTLWAQARQRAQAADQLTELDAQAWSEVQESAGQGVSGRLSRADGPALALRLGSAAYCQAPARTVQRLQVSLADEAGWLATFELQETLRPEAAAIIAELQGLGVAVEVLSGDAPAAVAPVAQALGMSKHRGGCTPQDKLQHIRAQQQQGHKVAMVGDGLNDGPVLAGADASFALGQAVPLAQSKSDFVLMGTQLTPLVETFRRSRLTLRIVKQNLAWAALYNAACVPLALLGHLPAWGAGLGMALSSLLVVLNALRLSAPLSAPISDTTLFKKGH